MLITLRTRHLLEFRARCLSANATSTFCAAKKPTARHKPTGGKTMATKSLNVNGKRVSITIDDPDMPLLYALRDNLALKGPRFGCGLAQCGACTVHVDGTAVRSCVMPLSSIKPGQKVVTLEGLGTPQKPHPVQRAFIEEQAVQCGYCINGMIMESAAFLAKNRKPTETQIKQALANNLCRCGTHARIVRAVKRASTA
jgi:nicotinate dehydrogenase subunit A